MEEAKSFSDCQDTSPLGAPFTVSFFIRKIYAFETVPQAKSQLSCCFRTQANAIL